MRKYGTIPTSLWYREEIKTKGPHCLLVAAYLLACPHGNMLYLFRIPIAYISHDTKLDPDVVTKHLNYLSEIGFILYDQESEFVWIREQMISDIGLNPKPNDKRILGMPRVLSTLSSNCIVDQFLSEFGDSYLLNKGAYKGAYKGDRSKEQEQEHMEVDIHEPVKQKFPHGFGGPSI